MDTVSITKQVFEEWGLTPESIPTSNKKESDWIIDFHGFTLLVEEKQKFENPSQRAERAASLKNEEQFGMSASLSPNNTISSIFKNAAKQLNSSASARQHDARIVWLTSVGFDAEAKHYQALSTLYGSTRIFESDDSHMKECYFFHNSDFYRFKEYLDGAVVAFLVNSTVTMKLCLNPFSERWMKLRDSPFAAKFPNGLIDPLDEEATGKAYIADTDIDRKQSAAVLAYLQSKYATGPLFNMDMQMASVVIKMPKT